MIKILTFALTLLVLAESLNRFFRRDKCRLDKFVKSDFNMEKFLNRWYPIMKTRSLPYVSNCQFIDIKKEDNKYIADVTNVKDNKKIFTFDLKPTNATNQFNFNVMGLDNPFVIADTDYDTYAVIYICTNMSFMKKTHALVLGRNKTLPDDKQKEIRNFVREKIGKRHKIENLNITNC